MSADKYLDYSKEHLDSILSDLFGNKQPSSKKDAIFMAGSPGAGKSEVAHLLADSYKNMIVLDTDDFRCLFPDYDGSNSSNFQKAEYRKEDKTCLEEWLQACDFLRISRTENCLAVYQR